jgi:hypothetical protein
MITPPRTTAARFDVNSTLINGAVVRGLAPVDALT